MAKIRIKSVPKNMMQIGGNPNRSQPYIPFVSGSPAQDPNRPVTDQERQQWNNYTGAMKNQPGSYVRNWQHNQDFQKQMAQQSGFDYNRSGVIQADMQSRSQSIPGSVTGIKAGASNYENWGGDPNWVGDRERQKQYTKYQYIGKRMNPTTGKEEEYYNSGTPQFTPKAQQQFDTDLAAARQSKQSQFQNNNTPSAAPEYIPYNPVQGGTGWPGSTPEQSTPPPSGLAATGFPTREEAIAKYKAKSAASQEPSKEPSADMSDYNMHSGKSEESKYGGKRKVRITGIPMTGIGTHGPAATPNATMMATGGYANQGATRKYGDQQQGQGYALDRFWSSPAGYLGSTSQVNPYGVTGNTLPEAKDGGDINAEKQEMVLGDFDQDGQQELMNVNGKPHTEGGKDINVPSNSFVFSDTKALKIKDPAILAMFNMSPKKGGYTPAEIAKKYDLNKLKKILDDPKADEVAKKTAQLMNDNYLAKLNKLAAVQEGMKKHMGMDHHDPNAQQQQGQPPVQEAGNMGPGGENMMQPEVMAKYGGQLPKAQFGMTPEELELQKLYAEQASNTNDNIDRKLYSGARYSSDGLPNASSGSPISGATNLLANQEVAQSVPAPYTMGNNVDPNVDAGYYLRPNQQQSAVNNSIPGLTDLGYGITPYRGNKATTWSAEQVARRGEQYGWQHKEPLGEFYSKYYPEESQARLDIHGKPIEPTSEKNVLGNRIGVRYEFPPLNMQRVPLSDFQLPARNPQDIPLDTVPVPGMPPVVIPKDEKTDKTDKKKGKGWRAPQMNPNFMGDFNNLLQMAQLKKFVPYEPVPQAVIPQTVFADYTAQAAAAQEAARSAGEGDVGSTGRAMSLARQGESLKPVREAIASTQAQNVGIANAANAQAAQITNELMAKQANRLAELNKAGFLADRDYQRERGKLQAEYTDRMQKHHDTAVKTAWLNKTSPYFDIDPYTQMPRFKPGNAEAEYWKEVKGAPDTTVADRVDALVKKGYSIDNAIKTVELERGNVRQKHTDPLTKDVTTTTTQYGGHQMQYGGTHMTMPEMAPRYQRNAERLPHYQIGGDFIPLASGPGIPMAAIDNLNRQQPIVDKTPLMPADTKTSNSTPFTKGKKGDIATMTNNPGNMKYSSWMKNYGGAPSGIPGKDGGEFAQFPDLSAGLEAYKTQIFGDTDGVFKSNYYKANTPVDTALKTWSNKGYGAEIYPEIKDKKLGELTPAQRDELIKRQIKAESGNMYKLLRQRGVFKYGGFALQKFIK